MKDDPEAVEIFLKFLYTDEVVEDLDEERAVQLLMMGDR
jgi:hypothetical protein